MNQKTIITIAVVAAAGFGAWWYYKRNPNLFTPVERAPQNGNVNTRNNNVGNTIAAVAGGIRGVVDSFGSLENSEKDFGGF